MNKLQCNKETEYLSNCTFVKTILMLIIVFYHSILFWSGNWFNIVTPEYKAVPLSYLSKWLNSFHIYTFTLVSGYIYYYMKYEKHSYNNTTLFIKNKVKRLLIPYIFLSVIWVIPISLYFYNYDVLEILKDFAIGISPHQLWFILMLFDVFIMFHFLSDFFVSHNVAGLIVVIFMYGVGGILKHILLPDVFQILTALQYMIFSLLVSNSDSSIF